jgi:hypothetical protein
MNSYIKKLQSKSEDTRKLIFVGSLIVCMSLVGVVWIYGLGTRFSSPKVAVQSDEDIKPFKLFTNSISDTFKNISASVGSINNKKDTTGDVAPQTEKQIDLIPVEYSTNQQ